MMTRTATTVWLDGNLLDDDPLQLHALTHALHYGSSVFEGIRVYPTPAGPAIFRLREHVDRLIAGAATYGMELAWDADALAEAIVDTVRASGRTPRTCGRWRSSAARRCGWIRAGVSGARR